jgi:succinate dehydrogenase / fumarate reductase flavoprotein subunit
VDLIVFGRRAGMHVAEYVKGADMPALPTNPTAEIHAELQRIRQSKGKTRPVEIRRAMQKLMMDKVSVFRDEAGMTAALDELFELRQRYVHDLTIDDNGAKYNTDLMEAWELGCLLDVAETTTISALERKESRGAHSREDYKDRDDNNWLVHTLIQRTDGTDLSLSSREYAINTNKRVDLSLAEHDERFIPKERVY